MQFRHRWLFIFPALLAGGLGSARAQSLTAALPARYDLRDLDGHSYIGPVHDQGDAGTCYAFAAIAAAESTYNRATGRYDDAVADFSESFIAWSLDPLYEGLEGTWGSNENFDEMRGLVAYGVPTEAAFPYVESDPGAGNWHWDAPRVQFSSWHRLPAYDVETMKRTLANIGAIDVGIFVDDALADYQAGVFMNADLAADDVVDYVSTGNHRVAIIGWDDAPAEGGDGAWIARNEWSSKWAEDGYMRIDYHAAKISLMGAYLVYGAWTGEDFHTQLTTDVVAAATQAGGISSSHGFYAWGGNQASLANSATVTASLDAPTGDAFTHGLFLWGGDQASLDNRGTVRSSARAATGLATAYGLCFQGKTLTNSGVVEATATNTGSNRATAYGARFFSFDNTGTFDNRGSIVATATGPGGNGMAIGVQINDAASIVNTGRIVASGDYQASGLVAEDFGTLDNRGLIEARSSGSRASGVYAKRGRIVNRSGATISAVSAGADAVALETDTVDVLNNGTISGARSTLLHSSLAGTGEFIGDLQLVGCRVAPGDGGIGQLRVDGDLSVTEGLTMEVEIGDGGYDALVVSGAATLQDDGSLKIVPVGYAAAGDYAFIAATSASGAFTEVSAPVMFEGTVRAGPGGFVLALTRHSYADFLARSDLDALGAALDRVRPHATGGVAAMLDQFDTAADGAAIGVAVAQLQPAINASAREAALQGVHRTGAQLAAQGPFPSAGARNGRGVAWFDALHGQERHGAAAGFRPTGEVIDGGMAGAGFPVGGHVTVGAAIADVRDRLTEREGSTDRARIESDRGYLYGRWEQRPGAPGWSAAAHLGLGFSRIETWRRVDFLDAEVAGQHRAWDGSVSLDVGREFRFRRWTFRPFAGGEYVYLGERAYTERGQSGAELAFSRQGVDSLLAGVGVAVGTRLDLGGVALMPEVRVRQARDFSNGTDGLLASFAGGDEFAAPGRSFSRDRTEVGFTLWAQLGERIGIAAYYSRTDYGQGHDFAQAAGGQLRVGF
ncbi:MAG: autotransporter domain-containing protein [Opitutaceae bacterium]|nr:autotransporter domain-containing protein [Opitutaceae bacterium]